MASWPKLVRSSASLMTLIGIGLRNMLVPFVSIMNYLDFKLFLIVFGRLFSFVIVVSHIFVDC